MRGGVVRVVMLEEAKEEHQDTGTRRKNQHIRYEALMYFFYIH
jgi:hypothetical protein